MKKKPLVSILVPNYNNGKYLEYCYESILNQTYSNLEVISYDNHSSDHSYEIMQKYKAKFAEKGIWMDVGMNKRNLGSGANTAICYGKSEGEYVTYLSSDDAMKPTFVEKCVDVFLTYDNVGMVMVHRDEMDSQGTLMQSPPFYNQSCIIPGEAQAAVFMMAGIAVPSQVMMSRMVAQRTIQKPFSMQVANDWLDNFMAACIKDVAYLKEALCEYRTHGTNDTNKSEENLTGIFEHYQLINAFLWIGESYGYKKHLERYEEAVHKLGNMCLRYALKMLNRSDRKTARRYLYLAPVFQEKIVEDDVYQKFVQCCESTGEHFEKRLKELNSIFSGKRTVSYDPPTEAFILT